MLQFKNTRWACESVIPTVKVKGKTGTFYEFTKSAAYRNEAQKVAPGQSAPEVDFGLATQTYTCETYKAKVGIPREIQDNADSVLNLMKQAANFVTGKVMLAKEKRFATIMEDTTNWNTSSAAAKWNAAGKPVTDMDTVITAVNAATGGMGATHCFMPEAVWNVFKRHSDVTNLIFGSGNNGARLVTPALVAQAFELEKVVIGYTMYTASLEGTAEASVTYASNYSGTTMWIGHVTSAPSVMNPSGAYGFQQFKNIRTWYDDDKDTDWVEGRESVDEKIVSKDCGHVMDTLL